MIGKGLFRPGASLPGPADSDQWSLPRPWNGSGAQQPHLLSSSRRVATKALACSSLPVALLLVP